MAHQLTAATTRMIRQRLLFAQHAIPNENAAGGTRRTKSDIARGTRRQPAP